MERDHYLGRKINKNKIRPSYGVRTGSSGCEHNQPEAIAGGKAEQDLIQTKTYWTRRGGDTRKVNISCSRERNRRRYDCRKVKGDIDLSPIGGYHRIAIFSLTG